VITVLSVVIGLRQAKHIRENHDTPTGTKRAPVVFLLAITAYVAIAVVDAATISRLGDKVFPMTIGIATLAGCVLLLTKMRRTPETDEIFIDLEQGGEDAKASHGLWGTLSWFLGLLALTGLFGFIIALAVFLPLFFRIRTSLDWLKTVVFSVAGIAFIIGLAYMLGRDFPPGLLQAYTNFPWPFR
jgi:putative tricarboxylic transport membrane protein